MTTNKPVISVTDSETLRHLLRLKLTCGLVLSAREIGRTLDVFPEPSSIDHNQLKKRNGKRKRNPDRWR